MTRRARPRRSSRSPRRRRSPPRRMRRPAWCCPTTPTTKGTKTPSRRSPSWKRASTRCRRWSPTGSRGSFWAATSTSGSSPPRGTAPASSATRGTSYFPQYAGKYGWVFLGDLLATPINTRGEPADLGDATGAAPRYDTIHSGGAPSFIANEINMTLTAGLGAERGRHRQRQLHAAQRVELQPGRRLRRRHRPARVDADPLAEDVDLRRQVRFGAGHRVPRPQVEPALRHHAVADRALHHRHRGRA